MKFDWKKVIFKDYPTMCSTLLLLALIQLWEVLANQRFQQHRDEVYGLTAAMIAISVFALIIRSIKKSAGHASTKASIGAVAESASKSDF